MKLNYLLAFAVATAFVSCSNDELVSELAAEKQAREIPIGFSVQKENVTRGQNLQQVKHYNFGVWAWKVNGKNSLPDVEVMNNYLVGYSGTNVGYDHSNATTWAETAGTTNDHTSPWFYEGLGKLDYTYNADGGFYNADDNDYMSNNNNQYLRYWDLAYTHTNFYCYTPYNKNVTFEKKSDKSIMTFGDANTIRDGYDEPVNSAYSHWDRSLSEYMYAGVRPENSQLSDVKVNFKHMGAQVFIRFYEDIPNYKVEIIDLGADYGTMDSEATTDMAKGIQLAPSEKKDDNTYAKAEYYTTQGATVTFNENDAVANYVAKWDGSTKVSTPLMFKIPQEGLATATDAPANLTNYAGVNGTTHKIIAEETTEGIKTYSYSPTIYYAVAQPSTSTTGFNFHISYRIIAEDNREPITVHNAEVFVPAKGTVSIDGVEKEACITAWQPNVKYTYTFKITKNSTGVTNPEETIDPTDPTPSTKKALYPIVFDEASIEEYSTIDDNSDVSKGTTY